MELTTDNKEFVETYAQMDDAENRMIHPVLFNLLGDPVGKRVVDYGCGEGQLAYLLANSGADVLGLDISQEMITRARARWQHPKLGFEQTQNNTIPVEEGTIDAVLSNLVFMMVPSLDDLTKIVSESEKALRSHGRLIFTITTPSFIDKEFPTFRTIFADGFRYNKSGQPYQFVLRSKDGREITSPTFRDYHYTWEDYLNLICDSNLRLNKVKEITIPQSNYPLYVVFSAEK
jgi:SAM-dependent methyltransferase